MGYNPKRTHIVDNASMLYDMKNQIERGLEYRFTPDEPDLYRAAWRVREVLKATQVFRAEFEGDFANLAEHVRVTVDPLAFEIVVKPRDIPNGERTLGGATLSVGDVLTRLLNYDGDIITMSFMPDERTTPEGMTAAVREAGFAVVVAKVLPNELVRATFERLPEAPRRLPPGEATERRRGAWDALNPRKEADRKRLVDEMMKAIRDDPTIPPATEE